MGENQKVETLGERTLIDKERKIYREQARKMKDDKTKLEGENSKKKY